MQISVHRLNLELKNGDIQVRVLKGDEPGI